MRFRPSRTGKRVAIALGLVKLTLEVVDWIVGKIGYLGIFTVPDDWPAALERGPRWLLATLSWLATWLGLVYDLAISRNGTLLVLVAIMLFLMLDPAGLSWKQRAAWFKLRHSLVDKIWIDWDAGLRLVRESPWGRYKEPRVTRQTGLGTLFLRQQFTEVETGLSDTEKATLLYKEYLRATLKQFTRSNPDAVRSVNDDGETEIQQVDEVVLRSFLDHALQGEIRSQFGEIPDFKIS